MLYQLVIDVVNIMDDYSIYQLVREVANILAAISASKRSCQHADCYISGSERSRQYTG